MSARRKVRLCGAGAHDFSNMTVKENIATGLVACGERDVPGDERRLLFSQAVAAGEADQRRRAKLSDRPALDDQPLVWGIFRNRSAASATSGAKSAKGH